MEAGRISRPLRGIGVRSIPNVVLDTMQRAQSVGCNLLQGAGVLPLIIPGVEVGVLINPRSVVADGARLCLE
jgi:hypothetical protein